MPDDPASSDVPLPKNWPASVKSLILQVISLAHLAIIYSRSWAANSVNARIRLQGKLERSQNEVSSLQEELRIKDARMGASGCPRRPHYRPVERLAILELKAARGWSTAQTARAFLVEPATSSSWLKRVDEEGQSALVQTLSQSIDFPASCATLSVG